MASAAAMPLCGWRLSPLIGFFGHGYFSVFGGMMAEAFPAGCALRRRVLLQRGARVEWPRADYGGEGGGLSGTRRALAFTAIFFAAAAGLILLMPETRGGELD
jgi:hypothetical protein